MDIAKQSRYPPGMGDTSHQHRRTHRRESEELERLRRIETRLTQLLIFLGADTQSQKPIFVAAGLAGEGGISLPSPHSSMKEIIDSIPENWMGPIDVFIGTERVASINRD